ncbi:hypothetical protein [Streptomyces sp. NPDC047014]|uniref:hypothetical protein n=1 Tax=Streptomyces sp. NPDC047014 TaxID=3155736 RepID=UPI0033CFA186
MDRVKGVLGALSWGFAECRSFWPESDPRFVANFSPFHPVSSQELAMADLAFVLATLAVFGLVALVARGVAKL